MSKVPAGLIYTADHVWLRIEGEVVVLGITVHAQAALGKLVFVQLPECAQGLVKGTPFAIVESAKSVTELDAPFDGEVVAVNRDIVVRPGQLNENPYHAWMLRMIPSAAPDLDSFLDAASYESYVKSSITR